MAEQLIPVVGVHSGEHSECPTGSTKLGGSPDMAPGATWPVPDPLSAEDAPAQLAFFAQIDLAELARVTADRRAAELDVPDTGRLLFFACPEKATADAIDEAEGDPQRRFCRVIWDTTPAEETQRLAVPAALQEDTSDGDVFHDQQWDSFWCPEKPCTLILGWSTLGEDSPELHDYLEHCATNPPAGLADPEQQSEALNEFYWNAEELVPGREWTTTMIGGGPICEQSDPRGYVDDTNPAAWQQLFQVSLPDLLGEYSEGTAYFLIPHDALRRRDFSEARVEFQQT
ncbi:hypothetical protein CCICO_08770 [Corynebacterium ciconiae DSM 44920]|nr:hypothetical protein CCICO_08770 [Corynebacterium ciconiae DSM 44920]